jgi:hypothetical protein
MTTNRSESTAIHQKSGATIATSRRDVPLGLAVSVAVELPAASFAQPTLQTKTSFSSPDHRS